MCIRDSYNMDILVKNTNRKFLPVILGTDANAYGIAKSFHKEYGITSLSLGKAPLLETKKSNIVKVIDVYKRQVKHASAFALVD